MKGKSAITVARRFGGRKRNFPGEMFWARGDFVSTAGLDEAMVRAYIRNQEKEDERYDQMKRERHRWRESKNELLLLQCRGYVLWLCTESHSPKGKCFLE